MLIIKMAALYFGQKLKRELKSTPLEWETGGDLV